MTPKIKRRKFRGTQPIKLLQHWLILWKEKKQKVKKLVSRLQNPLNPPCQVRGLVPFLRREASRA